MSFDLFPTRDVVAKLRSAFLSYLGSATGCPNRTPRVWVASVGLKVSFVAMDGQTGILSWTQVFDIHGVNAIPIPDGCYDAGGVSMWHPQNDPTMMNVTDGDLLPFCLSELGRHGAAAKKPIPVSPIVTLPALSAMASLVGDTPMLMTYSRPTNDTGPLLKIEIRTAKAKGTALVMGLRAPDTSEWETL